MFSKMPYVGIDIAKSELVVDLAGTSRPFTADAEGLRALCAELPTDAHVVCEATGGYERPLVEMLHSRKIPVSVVLPRRVRAFAIAQGLVAKTDRIDASLLSAYGRACSPRPQQLASAKQQTLSALVRARQGLVERISLEENCAEHLVDKLLRRQSKSRTDLLRRQLAELDLAIKKLIASDPVLSQKSARLEQIDGVGKITAWTMLSEVPELGSLEKGEAAALVGVAPHPNESGQRRSQRRISGGRAAARRVLYMAAISASQHNVILKEFYQRLRSQGKAGKVALVAVMRKLIELFNLLLNKDRFCTCG